MMKAILVIAAIIAWQWLMAPAYPPRVVHYGYGLNDQIQPGPTNAHWLRCALAGNC
jgi:hypothetical protein